jgi:chaperonin GroEL (HSP60 family)
MPALIFYCRVCSKGYCVYVQAQHAQPGNITWGVDGDTGKIVDMKELGVWEPLSVKLQTVKSAIEVCCYSVSGPMISVRLETWKFG